MKTSDLKPYSLYLETRVSELTKLVDHWKRQYRNVSFKLRLYEQGLKRPEIKP